MKRSLKMFKIPERIFRAFLMAIAGLLTFVGPTYMMYILERFGVPYFLYLLIGLASFTAGVILFLHLFRKEQDTGTAT
ncbi:MAG: hypothetical protein ACE5L6_02575 [Candidatus Bathyarchaeia archaeon]